MGIQIIFVLLFALNLFLIRLFAKYRPVGSVALAVLPLFGVFFDQPRFELDYFWWRIAGVSAILLGLALIVWARRTLGANYYFPAEKPKELVTEGPYALFRQPIYLGLIFIFVGWWWVWAAVYTFYFGMFSLAMIWLEAWFEEKLVMEKTFGAKFFEYKRQTGMFWIK